MPGYSKRWERLAAKAKAYYQSHPELQVGCWRCHRPINMWLHHNDALSFTMDHIVPKVLGGEDVANNALPAHRSCNTRRARNIDKAMSNVQGRIALAAKSTREW